MKWYTRTQYGTFVKLPSTKEAIADVMKDYIDMGLPGMVGSMDGTVIPVMATFSERMQHIGHKSNCTGVNVAFLVAHNRQILHVTPPYPATFVDSIIQKMDYSVNQVKNDPLYTEYPVSFRDSEGNIIHSKGTTLLVDGGYPSHKVFQTGGRHYTNFSEGVYCSHLESVRKDVECTFGVLKSRFRILKYGMRIANRDTVNCVIATCAGLHNELLIHDGRGVFHNYVQLDEDLNNIDEDLQFHNQGIQGCANMESDAEEIQGHKFDRRRTILQDIMSEHGQENQIILNPFQDQTFDCRRQLLIDHFIFENQNGRVKRIG